jgi:hypothetical protein
MRLRCESLEPPMSQLGHERRSDTTHSSFGSTSTNRLSGGGATGSLERPITDSCSVASDLWTTYSITSLAATRSVGGTVRSSVFAVLRLMLRMNFAACWTGSSAGRAPFRSRPT